MAKKESVLDENASIYQKREDKSEKEKWSELDRHGKWVYFNHYYRNKLIWSIIGVIAAISLLYSIFGPKVEQVLYAAIINDYWEDNAVEALEDDLKTYLQADPKWEEVMFDDMYFLNDEENTDTANYVQKLATYIYVGDVDLIIADEDQFEVYAEQDYFLDLEAVLPADLYELVEEHLVYYTSTYDGVEYPCGIRLGASPVYQSILSYQEDPILGIMGNTEYQDNAVEAIRYFFTSDVDYSNVEPVEE